MLLLLRAFVDANEPKFLAMDPPLFDGIIKELMDYQAEDRLRHA